jgi:hypothetical protein
MFPILDIISKVGDVIDKVIPDKNAAAAAKAAMNELALKGQLDDTLTQLQSVTTDQSGVDKVEAANSSMFVAGWRPMIGWVCGVALGSQYIVRPLIQWGFAFAHQSAPTLPGIDDQLWQLMFGLLGMGALRSFDKVKGVATIGLK